MAHGDPSGERFALFRLCLTPGLGPVRLRCLLDRFGSAGAVLAADAARLSAVPQIGPALAEAIRSQADADNARQEYERMLALGVRLVYQGDADYPPGFTEIPSPPPLFSLKGDLVPGDRLAVALVGTRRCSLYGRRAAEQLARDLAARGIAVVSGLARGIDAAAHQGALAAGGRTIAVLASGLANIYPPEHAKLADAVAAQGALLSEAPLDGPPIGELFPKRNRLISGLSLGVIVVEAGKQSGALSTARHALDQNREVFAIPGRIGDPASAGTNWLLQQGAHLVTSVDDVISQLGPIALPSAAEQPPTPAPLPNLNGVERRLWEAIGSDDVELETLLERTGLRASEASSALLMMEMRKLVARLPGNRYARRA